MYKGKSSRAERQEAEPQTIDPVAVSLEGDGGGAGVSGSATQCWEFTPIRRTVAAASLTVGEWVAGTLEGADLMVSSHHGVVGFAPGGGAQAVRAAVDGLPTVSLQGAVTKTEGAQMRIRLCSEQ